MNGCQPRLLDNMALTAIKYFNSAIHYERRQSWKKAIQSYEALDAVLPCVKTVAHSKHVKLKILTYECLSLRGVAYQKLGEHRKAVDCFRRAIKVLEQRKDNCCAGCRTGTFLHLLVPVLAKKSISCLILGKLDQASSDIDCALVKDFSNMDLFCIRSLVNFSRGRKDDALSDLKYVLKNDRSNLCAMILRGYFTAPKQETGIPREFPIDHRKACEKNPDCYGYVQFEDVRKDFHVLFERFLPSLRISHSVSMHDLIEKEAFSQDKSASEKKFTAHKSLPFLCGTPVTPNRKGSLSSEWCTRTSNSTRHYKSAEQLTCRHCRHQEIKHPCVSHVSTQFHPSSAPVSRQSTRPMSKRYIKRTPDVKSESISDLLTYRSSLVNPNSFVGCQKEVWDIEKERMYPKPWLFDKIPVAVPQTVRDDVWQVTTPRPQLSSQVEHFGRSKQPFR